MDKHHPPQFPTAVVPCCRTPFLIVFLVLFFHLSAIAAQPEDLGPMISEALQSQANGDFETALKVTVKIVAQSLEQFGPESQQYADALFLEASVRQGLEQFDEARKLAQKVTGVSRKAYGPRDPMYAKALIMQFGFASLDGEEKTAERLMDEVISILSEKADECPPGMETAMYVIAKDYAEEEKYDRAETLFQLVLTLCKPETVDPGFVAATHGQLLDIYRETKQFARAEEHSKRQLEIIRESDGEESERYALFLGSLGGVYKEAQDFDAAEKVYKRVLELDGIVHGEKSGKYATDANILANLYEQTGRFEEAETLKLAALAGDRAEYGEIHEECAMDHVLIGELYYNMARYEEATLHLARALEIYDALDQFDPLDRARALCNLGDVHSSMGRTDEGLRLIEQGYAITKEHATEEPEAHMRSLASMSLLAVELGRLDLVKVAISELEEFEESPERELLRSMFQMVVYLNQGDLGKTEEALQALKRISLEEIGELSYLYAMSLLGVGGIYSSMGSVDRARNFFEEAATRLESTFGKEHPYYGHALRSRAWMAFEDGDAQEAVRLQNEAVSVYEMTTGRENSTWRISVMNLALYQLLAGDLRGARETAKKVPESFILLHELMDGYFALYERDFAGASERFRSLAQDSVKLLGPGNSMEKAACLPLAWALTHGGLPAQGLLELEQALAAHETMRSTLMSEEQRMAFTGTSEGAFAAAAWCYAEQGDITAAFNTVERGRAISLREVLAARQMQESKGGLSPVTIVARDVDALESEQMRLAYAAPDGTRGIAATSGLLAERRQERDTLLTKAFEDNVRLKHMWSVAPPDIEAVRRKLGPDTVVVAYCQPEGDPLLDWRPDDMWIFLFDQRSTRLARMPLHGFDLAAAVERYVGLLKDRKSNERVLNETAMELRGVLIDPVLEELNPYETLVVVPWGELAYVPFSALLEETELEPKNIVLAPSVGIYEYIDVEPTPLRSLVALGDPQTEFPPLRGARQEVEEIQKYFFGSAVFFGSDATETKLRGPGVSTDVVHLACHGMMNEDMPAYSFLALAPGAGNDGRLEMHEIAALDWTPPELVVLSACKTGTGKLGGGSEVMALARGFMVAGAPSVVCSLWPVDDEATRIFMSAFYAALQGGALKAEALRKAQEAVRANPEYDHPAFWSPFVLWGGWK